MTRRAIPTLGVFLIILSAARADTPATLPAWRIAADARIEQIRKGDMALSILEPDDKPMVDVAVSLRQVRSDFHFGTAVPAPKAWDYSPRSRAFWGFVTDRFNTLVAENAMKWPAAEPEQDRLAFDAGDRLVEFARANDMAVRAHCLFWSRPAYHPKWASTLPADALRQQVFERVDQAVEHYKGKVIAWDVDNEILTADGEWYDNKLGVGTQAQMFKRAAQIDPKAALFVNEYEILGRPDRVAEVIQLVTKLRDQGAPVGGIGIQCHGAHRLAPAVDVDENDPNPPKFVPIKGVITPEEALASLDALATLKLPIHLTEVSFPSLDESRKADAVDAFYRVCFSHPAVQAVLLWGFLEGAQWTGPRGALVNKDYTPRPAATKLDDLLLRQWRTNVEAKTDASGQIHFRGFYGTYELSVSGRRPTRVTFATGHLSATATLPLAGKIKSGV